MRGRDGLKMSDVQLSGQWCSLFCTGGGIKVCCSTQHTPAFFLFSSVESVVQPNEKRRKLLYNITAVHWKPGHWLLRRVQICGADRSEGRLIGHPAPGLWTPDMWTSSSNILAQRAGAVDGNRYCGMQILMSVHLDIIGRGHHPLRALEPASMG